MFDKDGVTSAETIPPPNWLTWVNGDGNRSARAWVCVILCVICLPAFFTLLKLPPVILANEFGYAWIGIAKTLAFAFAALMFSLQISLPRDMDYQKYIWRSCIPDIGRALCLAGVVYVCAGLTMLRVAPVASIYFASSPQTLIQPIQSIGRHKECRRRCLFRRALGKAGSSYSIHLEDYPNLFAPITLYERPDGFMTLNHSMRSQPNAQVTGRGNWLGLRIDQIKAIDPSKDDRTGLTLLNPTG